MLSLAPSTGARCAFTGCLRATLPNKLPFIKTISGTRYKHYTLRSRNINPCCTASDSGSQKEKSRYLDASLENETLPVEAVQEHTLTTTHVPVHVPSTVRVKFILQRKCRFREKYNVVGSDPLFGNWDPEAGVPMEWSEGDAWIAEKDVPIGKRIEFKFVLIGRKGKVEWQHGTNRSFETTDPTISSLVVCKPWDAEEDKIEEGGPSEEVLVGGATNDATVSVGVTVVDSAMDIGGEKQAKSYQSLTERDTRADEGNGQFTVSSPIDEEDKPETPLDISTPDSTLVTAILDAAEANDAEP